MDWPTLLAALRVTLGAIMITCGVRLFYRDCSRRLRETRDDFPRMNPYAAIVQAEPGRGFYAGFAGVLLGIAVLPF